MLLLHAVGEAGRGLRPPRYPLLDLLQGLHQGIYVFNQQVGALQQFLNSPIPSGQPTLSPPRNTHLVSSRVSKLTCAKSPLAAAWALARIANFRLT